MDQELLALIVVGMTAGGFLTSWIRRRRRGPASLCPGNCVCPGVRNVERGSPLSATAVETPPRKK